MSKLQFSDFIRGFGSVLELFPTHDLQENIKFPIISDEEAIRSDWEIVGKDICGVVNNKKSIHEKAN